jgi:dTDP-4-amino-4,6-dideoxygalactose transaminase
MKLISLTKPVLGKSELKAVERVFRSGWVAGQGPQNLKLSESIRKFTGSKYAISVNNCTAGLHLSLLALGIGQGDEVIVADYTFPATGHSVLYCGAKPIFVDVYIDTYNINPSLIEKKITKKTKAIIVVHALGQMADMTAVMKIAASYKLKVIEDAACAFGAKHNGKVAGSFGDLAVFSFHARKNITSGEGGIIITNNKKYAETVSSLSCFGMETAYKRQSSLAIPIFNKLGYNYKLSDINATIIVEQLKKYPRILRKKRLLAEMYNRLLRSNKYLTTPKEESWNFHVYQTYVVVLDVRVDRNKLIKALKEEGIQAQMGTYASHIQPIYHSKDKCPNSLLLFRQSLALPLHYQLKKKEVYYIVDKLNQLILRQVRYIA